VFFTAGREKREKGRKGREFPTSGGEGKDGLRIRINRDWKGKLGKTCHRTEMNIATAEERRKLLILKKTPSTTERDRRNLICIGEDGEC